MLRIFAHAYHPVYNKEIEIYRMIKKIGELKIDSYLYTPNRISAISVRIFSKTVNLIFIQYTANRDQLQLSTWRSNVYFNRIYMANLCPNARSMRINEN